jgi:hypothetical protein
LAYVRGFDPYAAVTPVLPPDWLAAVPPVWRGVPAPYGPLWIVVSAGAAGISGGRLWLAVAALRVVAAAGVVVGGVGGWRLARRCGVAPATAVWLGILTPLVVVQAVSGAHNDAVLTALVLAGLAVAAEARQVAAARRRWWLVGLCGAAFGLAVAVKAVAVLAAPFAWLMLAGGWCVGAPPGRRPLAAVGAAFAAAATVAYTTVGLATGLGVGWVHGLAPAASMVEWSSPPTGVGMAVGYLLRLFGLPQGYPVAVAVARTVGLVVLAVIVARLWWAARAAASTVEVVGRAAAALVAGVALAPVFYPWYALTAAAVLGTCAGSRTTRRWLAGGSAVLVFAVLPDGYGLAVATKVPGAVLDLAVAVAAVVWWTRRRRRTRHDVPGGHRVTRPSPQD